MGLDVATLIWLFPTMFILHDFEEIITVERWLTRHADTVNARLPEKLAGRVLRQFSMTTAQFAVAVLFVFLFVSSATVMASQYVRGGPGGNMYVFTAVTLVFFVHAFTHIGQSVLFRSVTPGAITSVVVAIPYSLVLFRALFAEGLVTWQTIAVALPFTLLMLPVVLTAHWLGRRLI